MVDNMSLAEDEDNEEEEEDELGAALNGLGEEDDDDDDFCDRVLEDEDLDDICSSLKEDMVSDHLSDYANLAQKQIERDIEAKPMSYIGAKKLSVESPVLAPPPLVSVSMGLPLN